MKKRLKDPFKGRKFKTNGTSIWSSRKDNHVISILESCVCNHELRLYFTKKSWGNTEIYGLIYTDRQFEKEVQQFVSKITKSKVGDKQLGYSEQGMQGDDYVSMDIDDMTLARLILKGVPLY